MGRYRNATLRDSTAYAFCRSWHAQTEREVYGLAAPLSEAAPTVESLLPRWPDFHGASNFSGNPEALSIRYRVRNCFTPRRI
jgi:hypothetical protein